MNYQREAIYSRRRNAISGDKVEIDLRNMMMDSISLLVERTQGLDFEAFEENLMASLSIDCGFDADFYKDAKSDELVKSLVAHMQESYQRRMDALVEKLAPIIKTVYEKQGSMYKNIAIPISDGRKTMTLSVDLEKAYNSAGREVGKTLSKNIILYQIDEHWKQHLREMDDLKQSVQSASYEQKDPIVVYKLESYNLFADMLESLNRDVLTFLLRHSYPEDASEAGPPNRAQRRLRNSMHVARISPPMRNKAILRQRPKKIGRNDPCPCGSGKNTNIVMARDRFKTQNKTII